MPAVMSLLSRNALPPVSAASVTSVSCESLMLARCELYAEPVKLPEPRDAAFAGAAAGRVGHQAAGVDRERWQRWLSTAALTEASSCAWLSTPVLLKPPAK